MVHRDPIGPDYREFEVGFDGAQDEAIASGSQ